MNPTQHTAALPLAHTADFEFPTLSFLLLCLSIQAVVSAFALA
ncbi:hypothetical protein SAMN05444390_1011622 [Marinobacterium lutimaris]|uniref:Uncharacterized protein n=1 Tax=Marinobacterium lutimaris TaxID=568106 RepID=A0A1H5Y5W2_9GAMM|nr:hypothetical protein SAMN05444390_1011622 [Marinobacterium lutimaris]